MSGLWGISSHSFEVLAYILLFQPSKSSQIRGICLIELVCEMLYCIANKKLKLFIEKKKIYMFSYSKNTATLKLMYKTISSSIKLLFLKSVNLKSQPEPNLLMHYLIKCVYSLHFQIKVEAGRTLALCQRLKKL